MWLGTPRISAIPRHCFTGVCVCWQRKSSASVEPRLVNSRRISDNLMNSHSLNSGAMVQRLARGPFKAEIRVRFPLALPTLQ